MFALLTRLSQTNDISKVKFSENILDCLTSTVIDSSENKL